MSTATVTYSPEDNKIRLYVGRVPRDEYEELRAAGFVSTPKQDCDFTAVWTPEREDLAKRYLEDGEDIGDEDYSPLERSADRAERFEGYREKRTDARQLLNEYGTLVSICANGPRQRAALKPIAERWIDLPPMSFRESGTGVETAIVVIKAA